MRYAVSCRWERAQHLQARAASEISTSSLLPAYKAEAWLRKMQHLQKHNNTLAEQLDLLSQRLLASQQAQSEADLRLQHAAQHQVPNADSAVINATTVIRTTCHIKAPGSVFYSHAFKQHADVFLWHNSQDLFNRIHVFTYNLK